MTDATPNPLYNLEAAPNPLGKSLPASLQIGRKPMEYPKPTIEQLLKSIEANYEEMIRNPGQPDFSPLRNLAISMKIALERMEEKLKENQASFELLADRFKYLETVSKTRQTFFGEFFTSLADIKDELKKHVP